MSTQFQKSTLIRNIYVSRKNIIYYLKNLGYDVSNYETFNIAEINAMEQNTKELSELNFEVFRETDDGKQQRCCIMYYLKSNIKQMILENMSTDFYDNVEDKENTSLIVVTLNPMNDSLQKIIKKKWKKYGEYVIIMDLPGTQFNILQHSMVPKHEKLTQEEKSQVYDKYSIDNDKQIPEISMFDPVARVLLMRPGEACKIIRHDKISYVNEFYRVCVV